MSALGQKRTWRSEIAMSALPPKADIPRRDRNVRFGPNSDIALTTSIRSVYADYGTQWQEVAISPQHRRIKAGRATAVQKQSVLASKLIPEEMRELPKRNL
jgi:hypothetical protein